MVQTPISPQRLYPESDGKPMAENTLQYRWIVRLVSNLKHRFADQQVFVAGDLLWYPVPVERPPAPCQAPDVMVVLGRPDGVREASPQENRGSYKQWEEENIPPQVVFEILSPSNSVSEMAGKQRFYEQYGVLETFFYDPDSQDFWGFHRETAQAPLTLITPLHLPWTSPLLGVRFEFAADGLALYHPDGELFKEPTALFVERDQAQRERDRAQRERDQAQTERDRAFAKLRELGIDPATL
ncbi:Uma2 family endonuclease [Spirulina sp. CCNP1310]|uniref:Uma2 family endonuclease n=1 Tax=Spirulina sp. CCNP1310 TaxID=3110249 RepID=UPI002B21D47C|nr:Uma2 family endonuclease [Spirulina sp. CCNP1310]MEA5420090.1 Uma2 family endonuclease [Spirulina sp. CCNP1310]